MAGISMQADEKLIAEVHKAANGWIVYFKKGAGPVLVSVHEQEEAVA